MALEDFFQRYRNKQLLAQIKAAYADAPDAEDNRVMEIMRSRR